MLYLLHFRLTDMFCRNKKRWILDQNFQMYSFKIRIIEMKRFEIEP